MRKLTRKVRTAALPCSLHSWTDFSSFPKPTIQPSVRPTTRPLNAPGKLRISGPVRDRRCHASTIVCSETPPMVS